MRLLSILFLFFLPFSVCATEIVSPEQLPRSEESTARGVSQVFDLGRDDRRGVEARVQLRPQMHSTSDETLEENRQKYLISVSFVESRSGKILLEGQVAARTFTPDAVRVSTVRLEPQLVDWTAILLLPSEGETMIKIGCKLADGKKRIYRFFFNPQPVVLPEKMPLPAE